MSGKCVMVLGAAGRVGSQICAELLRCDYRVVLVDIVPQSQLEQKAGRLLSDAWLARNASRGRVAVYGGVNALDKTGLIEILLAEAPDLVINYAIPITWDATKRLGNYEKISAAGLGAFAPVQVITPLVVARAIAESGVDAAYMVGNLPDISAPIIAGIAHAGGVARPLSGAGNVGLNQVALRQQIAAERELPLTAVEVALVSHHVHWVAPREPGYSNEGPFLAMVKINGEDVTGSFSDLRKVMNTGVQNFYESDASFSSTTGILASQVAMALLDESGAVHRLHAPAPNGLSGGYPLAIQDGKVVVDLPDHWQLKDAVAAMEKCHTLDGVQAIEKDGTVIFTDYARDILRKETEFELPAVMPPSDIEQVAKEQIEAMTRRFQA